MGNLEGPKKHSPKDRSYFEGFTCYSQVRFTENKADCDGRTNDPAYAQPCLAQTSLESFFWRRPGRSSALRATV